MFTDASAWSVARGCHSDNVDVALASMEFSTETLERIMNVCEDLLTENRSGVLRVAEVLREARGRVPGRVMADAFGLN